MTKRRPWVLIASSVWMMLLMGTVYTYSVFRVEIESTYQVGTLLSGLPYMTSLAFYALSMMITGRFMKPDHLRRFVGIGTVLIAIGWLLSSLASSFLLLIFAYGVLIGTGVGLVYGVPIYMVQRLYPKRSGMMAGMILLGFGMSPLMTAPLARILVTSLGLERAFLVFGAAFLVLQLPLAFLYQLPSDMVQMAQKKVDIKLSTGPFKSVYALFVIATTIGLMMIGLSYQFGVVYYQFDPIEVTASLSFFAIMNGIARPIFGRLMDKKGFGFSITVSLGLIVLASVIGILNQGNYLWLYMVSFSLYWFNLGAWLAIVPASVKSFYGIAHYPRIYGVLFTAYGVGAIIGTLVSGTVMDILQGTTYLYVIIIILVLIAYLIQRKMTDSVINIQDQTENS